MSRPCTWCQRPMTPGTSCTILTYDDFADGVSRERIPAAHLCHDCNAPAGGLHHPGCDDERCPRCMGQAIACECTDEDSETASERQMP